ncbi:hypothetical protein, partial [Bacteroides clarus]
IAYYPHPKSCIYKLNSSYLCTECEDKLRLGIKNKQVYFILLPACIIFAPKYKDIQRFNEDI